MELNLAFFKKALALLTAVLFLLGSLSQFLVATFTSIIYGIYLLLFSLFELFRILRHYDCSAYIKLLSRPLGPPVLYAALALLIFEDTFGIVIGILILCCAAAMAGLHFWRGNEIEEMEDAEIIADSIPELPKNDEPGII